MANKNCSLKSHQYILNLLYSKTVTREKPSFLSHGSKQNGNTARLESSLSSLKTRKPKSCSVKTFWSPPEPPSQLNSVYLWEEAKKRLINDFQETGNWKDEFSILSTKQDSPLLPHHTTSSLFPLAQLSPALWETFSDPSLSPELWEVYPADLAAFSTSPPNIREPHPHNLYSAVTLKAGSYILTSLESWPHIPASLLLIRIKLTIS